MIYEVHEATTLILFIAHRYSYRVAKIIQSFLTDQDLQLQFEDVNLMSRVNREILLEKKHEGITFFSRVSNWTVKKIDYLRPKHSDELLKWCKYNGSCCYNPRAPLFKEVKYGDVISVIYVEEEWGYDSKEQVFIANQTTGELGDPYRSTFILRNGSWKFRLYKYDYYFVQAKIREFRKASFLRDSRLTKGTGKIQDKYDSKSVILQITPKHQD